MVRCMNLLPAQPTRNCWRRHLRTKCFERLPAITLLTIVQRTPRVHAYAHFQADPTCINTLVYAHTRAYLPSTLTPTATLTPHFVPRVQVAKISLKQLETVETQRAQVRGLLGMPPGVCLNRHLGWRATVHITIISVVSQCVDTFTIYR